MPDPENHVPGSIDPYYSLLNQIFVSNAPEPTQKVEELESLLGEYLKRCAYHFFPQLGDDSKAELVQQTRIKVWLKAGQCKGSTRRSIFAWIKKIVYTTGINLLRDGEKPELFSDVERNASTMDGASAENQPWDLAAGLWADSSNSRRTMEDDVVLRESIRTWMKELTNRERKVFLLCLYGYSKTEIAEMLQISNPRVSQYVEQIYNKYQNIA